MLVQVALVMEAGFHRAVLQNLQLQALLRPFSQRARIDRIPPLMTRNGRPFRSETRPRWRLKLRR